MFIKFLRRFHVSIFRNFSNKLIYPTLDFVLNKPSIFIKKPTEYIKRNKWDLLVVDYALLKNKLCGYICRTNEKNYNIYCGIILSTYYDQYLNYFLYNNNFMSFFSIDCEGASFYEDFLGRCYTQYTKVNKPDICMSIFSNKEGRLKNEDNISINFTNRPNLFEIVKKYYHGDNFMIDNKYLSSFHLTEDENKVLDLFIPR